MRLSASFKSWGGVFCVFLTKPCRSTIFPRSTQNISRPIFTRQIGSHFPEAAAEAAAIGHAERPPELDLLNIPADQLPVRQRQPRDPLPYWLDSVSDS